MRAHGQCPTLNRIKNEIFFWSGLNDDKRLMQEIPPSGLTPFVFSDPAGKRWPRLRLILVLSGALFFVGAVLFVQTLFVAPQMRISTETSHFFIDLVFYNYLLKCFVIIRGHQP